MSRGGTLTWTYQPIRLVILEERNIMNTVVLTGQLRGQPHFHWVGHEAHKQGFVAFLLRVRGPSKEGDSVARCVAYGRLAETIYELLRHNGNGWYEVCARWRRRKGDDGKFHEEFVVQPHGLHHVAALLEGDTT